MEDGSIGYSCWIPADLLENFGVVGRAYGKYFRVFSQLARTTFHTQAEQLQQLLKHVE